ncbi:hypothetical protein BJX76DRAFT_326014 [Aspergillus varians]
MTRIQNQTYPIFQLSVHIRTKLPILLPLLLDFISYIPPTIILFLATRYSQKPHRNVARTLSCRCHC